jgi:hypothetical protein
MPLFGPEPKRSEPLGANSDYPVPPPATRPPNALISTYTRNRWVFTCAVNLVDISCQPFDEQPSLRASVFALVRTPTHKKPEALVPCNSRTPRGGLLSCFRRLA